MKIQFIWCGNMWETILNSMIKNWILNDDVYVKTNTEKTSNKIKEKYQVNIWENIDSDFLFLAVKPQQLDEIDLQKYNNNNLIIISVLAWTSVVKISEKNNNSKIIRCMPNLPISVWKWIIWYFSNTEIDENKNEFFTKTFNNMWELIKVNSEDKLDKITALSWSGPAYFYYFTEKLKEKAKKMWFSDDESMKIANNTFLWSALYFGNSDKSVYELKKQVTSKWWTTEFALKTFEAEWLQKILEKGIDSAYERAKGLSK